MKSKINIFDWKFFQIMHIRHWINREFNNSLQKKLLLYWCLNVNTFSEKIVQSFEYLAYIALSAILKRWKHTPTSNNFIKLKFVIWWEIISFNLPLFNENRCKTHQNFVCLSVFVCVWVWVCFGTLNFQPKRVIIHFVLLCCCRCDFCFSLRFSHFNMAVINQFYCCIV